MGAESIPRALAADQPESDPATGFRAVSKECRCGVHVRDENVDVAVVVVIRKGRSTPNALAGNARVNIGSIHLTRSSSHGEAFSVINVDSPLEADVLQALRDIPHVQSVTPIRL